MHGVPAKRTTNMRTCTCACTSVWAAHAGARERSYLISVTISPRVPTADEKGATIAMKTVKRISKRLASPRGSRPSGGSGATSAPSTPRGGEHGGGDASSVSASAPNTPRDVDIEAGGASLPLVQPAASAPAFSATIPSAPAPRRQAVSYTHLTLPTKA